MSNSTTKYIKNVIAKEILESVNQSSRSNYYMLIGDKDATANTVVDDSISGHQSIWQKAYAAKKITDVQYVVPRVLFSNGIDTVWEYSDTYAIENVTNYVATANSNVYLCLSNNNGAAATVEPLGTGNSQIVNSDGYVWKYLYSVTSDEYTRYSNLSTWYPVFDNADVQEAAVDGSIQKVIINSAGEYDQAGLFDIEIESGNGSNFAAKANITASGLTNVVSEVIISNYGQDYNFINLRVAYDGANANSAVNSSISGVLSPAGGLGSNNPRDLSAYNLMFIGDFDGTEDGKIFIGNSYGMVAIVKDPVETNTSSLASNTVYNLNTVLDVSGFTVTDGPFANNDVLLQADTLATANVIYYDSVAQWLYVTNIVGNFAANSSGLTVTAGSSTASTNGISQIIEPELKSGTGEIISVVYQDPIERSDSQKEINRIIIKL